MPKNNTPPAFLPSRDDVNKFEMLNPMIASDRNELRELSKKKQDEPLNKFKVANINKKLKQIRDLLKNEPTIEFLDLLDENTLPTNSDAVLILSQYTTAMDQFRRKYAEVDSSDFDILDTKYSWKTKG